MPKQKNSSPGREQTGKDRVLGVLGGFHLFETGGALDETIAAAQKIAGFTLPVIMMIKEAVNRAYESSLAEGLLFERRAFHAAFALDDQKEGMRAFIEKRPARFEDR